MRLLFEYLLIYDLEMYQNINCIQSPISNIKGVHTYTEPHAMAICNLYNLYVAAKVVRI